MLRSAMDVCQGSPLLRGSERLQLCDVRSDLLDAFLLCASLEWVRNASDTAPQVESVTSAAYKKLPAESRPVRLAAETALDNLRAHQAEHGC